MLNESWEPYVLAALRKVQEEENTREFGKLVQYGNEELQKDWINYNTALNLVPRKDNDHNESSYDLVTENFLRIQSKIRSGELHLENTRRHSNKNAGAASKTGHTAYSVGEADVYIFTMPKDKKDKKSFMQSTNGVEILAIPEHALIDPNNPGFLKTRVLAGVVKEYKGRAVEILETLDQKKAEEKATK
jgi:hypothetical protein